MDLYRAVKEGFLAEDEAQEIRRVPGLNPSGWRKESGGAFLDAATDHLRKTLVGLAEKGMHREYKIFSKRGDKLQDLSRGERRG